MTSDTCDLLCLDLPLAERIREAVPSVAELERAAAAAKACADPTRVALLTCLDQADELCVCDLTWIVGRSQGLVSHHLGRLRAGGLVTARRSGKVVFHALTDDGRRALRGVLEPTAEVPA